MKLRNQQLVNLADLCVCYYSGKKRSGTGNVNIILEGENTLKSGRKCVGLQKNGSSGTLTITGTTGSLNVTGDSTSEDTGSSSTSGESSDSSTSSNTSERSTGDDTSSGSTSGNTSGGSSDGNTSDWNADDSNNPPHRHKNYGFRHTCGCGSVGGCLIRASKK